MKNLKYVFILLLVTSFFGCVQFKEATLYKDSNVPEVNPANIKDFYSLNVFGDAGGFEVWGLVKTDQKDFSIAPQKDAYKGTGALKLKWDKFINYNTYIGVGFGWNGWGPKNLEPIVDSTGIEFYVKGATDSSRTIIVGIIEDYSGNMAACANLFDPKFMKKEYLTKDYQRVFVPFSAFNINYETLDWSNVMQLIFECHVEGDIYVDEIKIASR